MNGEIALQNIRKSYPTDDGILTVLEDLALTLPRSGITVVLGKSGCGKTTLLRLVGGLDTDYEGTITYPKNAKTGIVFQEPRLMPWLSVRKNIAFGQKRDEIDHARIQTLIEQVGLTGFENAKPHQLSGGMEQRTAIARALAVEPDFLLMDEPFAALDYFTRGTMQQLLLDIHRRNSCGVLFITHSIEEALTLGDRIVILKDRRIVKTYTLSDKPKVPDPSASERMELREDILRNIADPTG